MSNISIAGYAAISKLDAEETAALTRVLNTPELLRQAEFIAESVFIPQEPAPMPQLPESPKLSQAWFAAAFLGAEASRKHFEKCGFPEAVWRDTLTDLPVWLRNEKRNAGVTGLGPLAREWEVILYHGGVTRHGRLECNSEYFFKQESLRDSKGNIILAEGDPLINLHIPEDGPMKIADCGESMRRMADFFDRYRQDFKWKGFVCQSWLLDRQLCNMLPASSNIVKFQKLGVKYFIAETQSTLFRIFGNTPPDKVVNPSTLQRNAAEFLRNGGKFCSEGIYISRSSAESVDYDLEKLIGRFQ